MIYQYRCACGIREEDFPMGSQPADLGTCPTCERLCRRVYNPLNIIYGPDMKPPWADKIQRGSEEAKRFR